MDNKKKPDIMYEYMAKWEEKNAIKNEDFKIAMELGFMEGWKKALENTKLHLPLADVSFQLFQELYGSYVQMDDRFETVHIWNEELALRNKGRWTPILISKAKYEDEKLHSWNN